MLAAIQAHQQVQTGRPVWTRMKATLRCERKQQASVLTALSTELSHTPFSGSQSLTVNSQKLLHLPHEGCVSYMLYVSTA